MGTGSVGDRPWITQSNENEKQEAKQKGAYRGKSDHRKALTGYGYREIFLNTWGIGQQARKGPERPEGGKGDNERLQENDTMG